MKFRFIPRGVTKWLSINGVSNFKQFLNPSPIVTLVITKAFILLMPPPNLHKFIDLIPLSLWRHL